MLAFKAVTARLRTPEDYELITYRMMAQLAAQGVVHAEVYVSVGVVYYWRKAEFGADPLGFDRLWDRIFRGMEAGRVRGERDFGVSLYWIFDAVRHFGVEEAARVFRKAAELRMEFPSIIGIGIGGDERRTGAEPFRELYAEARDAGLRSDRACWRDGWAGEHLGGAQYRRRADRPWADRDRRSRPDGDSRRAPDSD